MPIFEYICEKCGEKFEELVKNENEETVSCPKCNSTEIKKQFSVIGGISMGGGSNSCNPNCPGASSCGSSHEGCCGCGH
ncbi:MAG: zinc ribbon domain-containing protein [Fibrobacter sp.]|nr:zinc ribbon domain-containing protein [Fibrobacter sp.]